MNTSLNNKSNKAPADKSLVWDLPLRLFHWLLVLTIAGSYISVKADNMEIHIKFAMFTTGLICFRLLWGFFGSQTARFRQFSPTRARLTAFFTANNKTEWFGHSPLGALSIFAMLFAITVQLLTGYVADDEIYITGPLVHLVSSDFSSWATGIHALNSNFLLFLIALHLIAVLTYLVIKKQNLISPMFSGYKAMQANSAVTTVKHKPLVAAVLALVAVAMVYVIFYQL